MRVSVVNHCSHNKGDNSVLFFLANKLKEWNGVSSLTVSTSDGEKPFWDESFLFEDVTFWGSGKIFNSKDESILGKVFLKIKNKLYKRFVYRCILFLYARKIDYLALIWIKFFYDKRFLDMVASSDVIVSTGGHHLSSVLDVDGVNAQFCDLVVVLLYNKRLMLWSQSIGPFETQSKYIKSSLLRLLTETKVIVPRDKNTLDRISKLSNDSDYIEICPDSVFGVPSLSNFDSYCPLNMPDRYAVICIYTASRRSKKDEDIYIATISKLVKMVSSRGILPVMLPMQYKGLAGDERPIIKKIINESAIQDILLIDEDVSPVVTLNLFKGAALAIGHKTHSVVYGLAMATPTLAICYHEKTRFFMRQFGVEFYAVNDTALEICLLEKKIEMLLDNSVEIKKELFDRRLKVQAELNSLFTLNFDKLIN